ncbi:hypothetical protein BXT84_14720 [Sulfobacillus thermotolerans]|uniref:Glycosyltransferase family 1 protein n=1 Tax=Sulfobacillus thermotolerans TaxID=338644 RepID=A0ABM6RUJ9_9FIRM|nr:hypothetical protein BXT84_14720 [Sulfobacillus thermotolerans]
MDFEITILQPDNYIHSLAFAEVLESLAYGLDSLGHRVHVTKNHIDSTHPTIILGANLLQPQHIAALPAEAIVYNLEQITQSSPWMTPQWLQSLQGRVVWEYSLQNMPYWQAHNVHAVHVPIGYVPSLTRINRTGEKDIDVVFYGSRNERRTKILEALAAQNLRVVPLHGVYGAQRDSIIARSKLAINIHFYVPNIFEEVRVSYLVANQVPVLSERNADTYVPDQWEALAYWAPYEKLVDICQNLLTHPDLELEAAKRQHTFMQNTMARILLRALEIYSP